MLKKLFFKSERLSLLFLLLFFSRLNVRRMIHYSPLSVLILFCVSGGGDLVKQYMKMLK